MREAALSRVPNARFAEVIGEGLSRLPEGMRLRLGHVQFVCGVDPVFAGLHGYEGHWRAHCCYPYHISGPRDRRVTTVVLPVLEGPHVVVHELGHALHETIGLSHIAVPVTEYAATNHEEAFAEALVAWTHWYGDQATALQDKATRALFGRLAR